MTRKGAAKKPIGAWVFVVIHIIIVMLPLAVVAIWAFSDRWAWPDLLPQSVSTRGMYQALFANNNAGLNVLGQSVAIALATALLTTLIAAMAARAISHYDWHGKNVFTCALMLPFLVPSTVFAMGIQIVFLQVGLARTVFGVVLAHSIIALPYACVIMIDVTRAMGTRLEDAAQTLGANKLQMLTHVTLPSLVPGILSAMSMSYIMSFSQYFLTLLIGGGAVRTYATVMFPYLSGSDRTIAAAYGLVFIVVTMLVFFFFEWLLKRAGVKENADMFTSV